MDADQRRTIEQTLLARPWVQLVVGVVAIASVANMQYGWTLFVDPIEARHHWGPAAVQVAFTWFIVLETWVNPFGGYFVDRFEPRFVVLVGAVLVVLSWFLNSIAGSLTVLYLGCAVGGVGTGCVYGACLGNAIKWFPARRGLAAGLTAAGFGAGAAITVAPIANMIQSAGYEKAFAVFGLIQGGVVAVMSSLMMPAPASLQATRVNEEQSRRDYTPAEVLRSPVFYMLYLLYMLVAVGGLTLAASVAPIAYQLRIADKPVNLLTGSVPALLVALPLSRVCDGASRPLFGWISDRIGRELTMAFAFMVGGMALLMLDSYGTDPESFILLTAVYFGVYGDIFSLFPATAADTFGARFATANIGMLYTAKGAGSLLVPVATSIAHTHGWGTVFIVAMCFNLTAALLAAFALGPLRERHLAEAARTAGAVFRPPRRPPED